MYYQVWTNCVVSEFSPYGLDDKKCLYNVGYFEDGEEHILSVYSNEYDAFAEQDRLEAKLKVDQMHIEFRSDLRNN